MTFNPAWDTISANGIVNPLDANIDVNDNEIIGKSGSPGGNTVIRGGPSTGGGNDGADVNIYGGTSANDLGGNINLYGGAGDGDGGTVNVRPGPYRTWFRVYAINNTDYVGFQCANSPASAIDYTWPAADPTTGQVLSAAAPVVGPTATTSSLSWVTRLANISEDSSPQLGANLDLAGYEIVTADDSGFGVTIKGGQITTGGGAGLGVLVRGGFIGSGATTITAGAVTMQGGTNNRNSGTAIGGAAQVQGGAATNALLTSGQGGPAQIRGGDGRTLGGNVSLQPGRDTGDDSLPGIIEMRGPTSSNTGARIRMFEANNSGGQYWEYQMVDTLSGNLTVPMQETVTRYTAGTHLLPANQPKIVVDASGGVVTLNLHAASFPRPFELTIKRIDNSTNAVTINAIGGDTLEGVTNGSISLTSQYQSVTVSNETATSDWWIF